MASSRQMIKGWAGIWGERRLWLVCLVFSMAPDMDAVAGIVLDNMASCHNQITHSLCFGLIFCAAVLPVTRKMLPGWSAGGVFTLTGACYGLHILLDWMTHGRGVMLLWPFSNMRFHAPMELFCGLRWSEGISSSRHVDTLVNEMTVIFCVAAIIVALRFLRNCLRK